MWLLLTAARQLVHVQAAAQLSKALCCCSKTCTSSCADTLDQSGNCSPWHTANLQTVWVSCATFLNTSRDIYSRTRLVVISYHQQAVVQLTVFEPAFRMARVGCKRRWPRDGSLNAAAHLSLAVRLRTLFSDADTQWCGNKECPTCMHG